MKVSISVELPEEMHFFQLPAGVQHRLQHLLDKQDSEEALSASEREEAEGLVDVAELLTLLRLRAERASCMRMRLFLHALA